MKCFVLSLHRTGTKSTAEHLEALGLSTAHFPSRHRGEDLQEKIRGRETDLGFVARTIEPVIAKRDAVMDVPIPVLYRELFEAYPQAKFILLHRPRAAWIASVRKSAGGRELNPFEKVQYWHYLPDCPDSLDNVSDQALGVLMDKHISDVTNFFAACGPSRLGTFALGNIDCGASIARFLGRDAHDPLPRASETRVKPSRVERYRVGLKNLAPWPAAKR